MFYYFATKKDGSINNAGSKAPLDIERICERKGAVPIYFPQNIIASKRTNKDFIMTLARCLHSWTHALKILKKGDSVVIQYPTVLTSLLVKIYPLLIKKKVRVIVLIHDLSYLRWEKSDMADPIKQRYLRQDLSLKFADKIICHNERMKEYLIGLGFERKKIDCIGIFDYLAQDNLFHTTSNISKSLVYAGNLNPKKARFIYDLPDFCTFDLHLFGINYAENKDSHAIYHGFFHADDLPMKMNIGMFGLVWDGESCDTCEGNFGEYLRFNNPHKCSLYLASNLPVIIWDKSAIADYIEQNKLGISVASLLEVQKRLEDMTYEEYEMIKQNVVEEGKRIRAGFYTERVLGETLS